jgi:MFS family permease
MSNEQVAVTETGPTSPPWRPVRTGIALAVGSLLCLGPFMAFNGILLPARVEVLAPDDKVAVVSLIAVAGVIVATVANVLFGALSDMTRSRFGRRAPWMVVGSLLAGLSLLYVTQATSIASIVVGWCFFQLCLNAVIAPLIATLPDRVPVLRRGTMSALYGLGQIVGISLSQIIAPFFLGDPTAGMTIFAIAAMFGGPLAALIAPDSDNRDQPRQTVTPRMLLRSFAFPTTDSKDYYLVFGARALNTIGTYVVSGYQLFILKDYLGASAEQTASILSLLGVVQLLSAVVIGTAAGPLSDLAKRRRVFLIGASVLMAFGVLFLFAVAEPWAMFVFAICNGLGGGVYNSIEQVVSTEVLPETGSSAKDLGFLNVAATGGQAIAPAATSGVIAVAGTFAPAFLFAGACLLGAAACFGAVKKSR